MLRYLLYWVDLGPVKELRETPLKKHQRFVEFYDVRDAAKALGEIHGKPVVIEFSRPGGHSRKFFNAPSPAFSANFHHTKSPRYPPVLSPPTPPPPPPPPLHRKLSGRLGPNVSRSHLSQTQFSIKKSSFSKGSPKSANLEAEVASMSLGGDVANGIEEKETNGPPKRNAKKCPSNNSAVAAKQPKSSRPWKGRQAKKFDSRFLINEDAILEPNCRDSRTTVMIKNIPNKYRSVGRSSSVFSYFILSHSLAYVIENNIRAGIVIFCSNILFLLVCSQKLLLNMLDNHCIHCNEQIADGDDQPLSSYDFVYLPIDFK